MVTNLLRNVAAAGATAFAIAFSQMDSHPDLFVYDKFFTKDTHLDSCFRGKTLWITGASSGIGAELALRLSNHGANLILSARPSSRLDSVANQCRQQAELSGTNGTVRVVPVDLSSSVNELSNTVDSLVDCLQEDCLDFVVLNAGKGQLRPASQTDSALTGEVFQVNTLAPITLTQILLERGILDERKGRHIVVTSSLGGRMGVPLSASYAASKHALHGYYNSLKAELPWLRVDLICPGSTDTEFHQSHIGGSSVGDVAMPINGEKAATPERRKQLKMSVQRCTSLFISSMMMKRGGEYWIADQPVLLGLYANQLFPGLFQKTLNKIGPLRLQAWKDGKDLYDPQTWKDMNSRK